MEISNLNVIRLSYQPRTLISPDYLEYLIHKLDWLNEKCKFSDGKLRFNLGNRAFLHNIHFKAKKGTLTAIFGDSEERSTLIDLLVGQKRSGLVGGNITLNGNFTNSDDYYSNISFVQKVFFSILLYVQCIEKNIFNTLESTVHSWTYLQRNDPLFSIIK
jgi:ABC-type transport system involved in cytochrome bd biosynthesis fused ATPase/permease subunit